MLSVLVRPLHPSWCLVFLMLGFIGGCFLSALSGWFLQCDIVMLGLILPIVLFVFVRPSYLVLPLALISGFICAEVRITPDLMVQQQWQQLIGQTVSLTGTLTEDPTSSSEQLALQLNQIQILPVENSVENSEEGTTTQLELSGTIYVLISDSDSFSTENLMRSDTITLTGVIQEGFGTFVAAIYRPIVTNWVRASPGDLAARFKLWFANLVRQYIPNPASELGLSYLLGYKASLPASISETLQIVGMTHVVVASGSHLGILVGVVRKLFGRISKFASLFFSMLLIIGFLLVVGFTSSMVRAAFVTILTLTFGYFGRHFAAWRILLIVATLTLLFNPLSCLSLSWQLSFASFSGVLLLAPRLQTIFYGGKHPSWLARSFLTSLATLFTCAPLLIYTFGSISLLSIIANLIILPTLPIAMLLVFLTGITSLLPFLAKLVGQFAYYLLSFHLDSMTFLSQFSSLVFNFPSNNPQVFLLYLSIFPVLLPSAFWAKFGQLFKRCYNNIHDYSFRIRDG